MKTLTFLLLALVSAVQLNAAEGPFFGAKTSEKPQLLAPDLLMSPLIEFNGTFNPEGTLFYYTTDVPGKKNRAEGIITYTSMNADGSWNPPAIAPFSGQYSDYDPIFAPDGQRLYFSSRRPMPGKGDTNQSNVWYIEKQSQGWSEPTPIALTDSDNYYNSITRSGVLYFNTFSNGDMLTATEVDGKYSYQTLPAPLNKEGHVHGDPFISPDGDYLIYRQARGEGSLGQGDLFISFNINGQWTEPENLGEPINSTFNEMCPYVTTDGKMFIFSSARMVEGYPLKADTPISQVHQKHGSKDNGYQNIYYMSTDFIERMRAKHQE